MCGVVGQLVDRLVAIAAQLADPATLCVVDELCAPVRVAVVGRVGCGRRTVARALRGAGVPIVEPSDGAVADVDVYVVAETLKPEDRRALSAVDRPTVVVLNKADLAGFGGDGPLATAARRCHLLREMTGTPVYPLAALAAAAALDDTVLDETLLDALRILTADPADLGSTGRFVAGEHPIPAATRQRLLAALDLFGIAHAVRALRGGADRDRVIAALRDASAVDAALDGIAAAAAPVRYQRLTRALSAVAAAGADDDQVADFLAGDDVVAARMAAAGAVVAAAGMTFDRGDSTAAHLRRAVVWQRYSRGPVSMVHARCGADIARGSLRMWERTEAMELRP
ncbi:hypothetical protein ACXDF8_13945 [Mycolicibacterium sp. CBM1]